MKCIKGFTLNGPSCVKAQVIVPVDPNCKTSDSIRCVECKDGFLLTIAKLFASKFLHSATNTISMEYVSNVMLISTLMLVNAILKTCHLSEQPITILFAVGSRRESVLNVQLELSLIIREFANLEILSVNKWIVMELVLVATQAIKLKTLLA